MRNNLSINPQNLTNSTFYKKNFYPRTSSSQSLNIPNNIYQSKEIYALKPQKYRINIETIPKEIYNNMLIDVNNVFPAMSKKVDLNNYGNKLRYYVIQSIINLIEKYKLNRKILFFSVYLMDKLLAKKLQFDIETIGLGVFIISCKFLEIDGQIPNVKNFLDFYNYINIRNNNTHHNINFKKITLKEINYVEIKCLKKLDYNLRVPQPINFINILLINGIVFTSDKNDNKNNKINGHIYNLPLQIYEQIIILNADYLQFHPFHLACGCVACAREIYGLEKWNDIFKNLYNITFSKFEEVYQFIKDQKEEYLKYYEYNKEIRNNTKHINNNSNSNIKNKELTSTNSSSTMSSNNKTNNNNNNYNSNNNFNSNKIVNELFINNKFKFKLNTNNINNLNESASTKNINTISINYKEKYFSNNNNNINTTMNYNINNTINNNNNNKVSYNNNNNNKTIVHNNSNNNYNTNTNSTTTHNRIISILNDKNKIFKPKNLNLDFKSLETFISNKKHQNSCIDIRDNENNNININDSIISTTDSSRIKNNNNNNNAINNIIHNSQSFSGYNKIKYLNSYSKINPYKRNNNNNLENKIKNNNREKENSNNKLITININDTSSNLNGSNKYNKIEYDKIKKNLIKNKIDSRYNTINTNNNISNNSFNYLNNYSMYSSNHSNLRKKVKEDYNSNNTINVNNTFTNANKRSNTNNNVNKNNNNINNNILKKSSSIIKEIHNMNIKNKLNANNNFTLNGMKGINTQSKITYLLKMKK